MRVGKRIRHIAMLNEGNDKIPIELTARFYMDTFGFNLVSREREKWRMGQTDAKLDVCKLRIPRDRTVLEIINSRGNWAPHICIEVEDWPQGVTMIEPVRIDEGNGHPGGLEVRFCIDPLGNFIELVKLGGRK